MRDQSAIKGKLDYQGDKTKLVSHFWGSQKLEEERRREEEEEEGKKRYVN